MGTDETATGIVTTNAVVVASASDPGIRRLAELVSRSARDAAGEIALAVRSMTGSRYDRLAGSLALFADGTRDIADAVRSEPSSRDRDAVRLGRDPLDVGVYDDYFGLHRVATATSIELLSAAVPALSALVAVIARSSVPGDYKAQMYRFIGALAADCAGPGRPSVSQRELFDVVPVTVPCTMSATNVWIHGHRLYGLANQVAAARIDEATRAVAAGDLDEAAARLASAVPAMSAITASMVLAADMTALTYEVAVRPTMRAPSLPIELTGFMNLDHANYRRALNSFIEVCGVPYQELASASPALADARDDVLDLDAHDLTEHIALTHRLVGTAAALDQRATSSAVQMLRRLDVERRERYSSMLRLGFMTATA